jgi:hypothetical protein
LHSGHSLRTRRCAKTPNKVEEIKKGSTSISTKRLKAEHPEIEWSEYEKRGADTVALTIKEEA